MRRVLTTALAAATVGLGTMAAPAYATPSPTPTPSNDPCNYAVVTGAIACVGYYGGNLLTGGAGSATTATEQNYINMLLSGPATSSGGGYSPPYTGLTTTTVLGALGSVSGTSGVPFTYNFSPLQLSGLTVFAAHFGNTPLGTLGPPAGNDVTAFWLLDLGNTPTSDVTISNGQGVSNAQIFATAPVPEPATWGLMLLGFGGIGMALRRSRRRSGALMQVA